MLLMSGRTGKVLRWLDVPEKKETYYSPQIYLQVDGTRIVLFGTGGETHGGSLWVITLDHLRQGRIDMVSPHGAPQTGQDRYGESLRSTSDRAGSIW